MGKAKYGVIKGTYRHEMKLMYLSKTTFNKFNKETNIYKFSMLKDGKYYYFSIFGNKNNEEFLSRKNLYNKQIYTVSGFVEKKVSTKDDKEYTNFHIILTDYI